MYNYVFLMLASNTDPNHYFWLGGTDAVSEGEWIWSLVVRPISVRFVFISKFHPISISMHEVISFYSKNMEVLILLFYSHNLALLCYYVVTQYCYFFVIEKVHFLYCVYNREIRTIYLHVCLWLLRDFITDCYMLLIDYESSVPCRVYCFINFPVIYHQYYLLYLNHCHYCLFFIIIIHNHHNNKFISSSTISSHSQRRSCCYQRTIKSLL